MNTPLPKARVVLIALFFVCFFTVFAHANSPAPTVGFVPTIRWETDINVAFTRAEQEQRPLFLHFIGNDCQPAKQMESEVFTQPNVVAHLNSNFVMVNINASENAALAQQFSVTAIPTDLIIKPNRQLIHRRTGGITAERFTEYLSFLQKTLQPAATPALTENPPAPAANTATPNQATAAVPAVVPQQREPIAIPDTIRDPFMQQQQPSVVAGTPPNVGTTSPSSANPLRTIESAVKPAPVSEPSIPMQTPTSTLPIAAITPSVPLTVTNEPTPPKTMVEVPLALEGFCPVTLCSEERWIPGNPAFCTMYQGHLFRFASSNALVAFAQNPAKYMPIAMGEDIVLMVDRNKRINGDRKFGAWFQERVFLFSNQETLDAFAARPEYYTEIALKYEIARKEQPAPIVY